MQTFVIFIEPALDQIANHGDQFVETFALRRHFRLVANRDKCAIVPLDLKNEFLRHGLRLAHGMDFDKTACAKLE
jgi:hypothetical protein